MHASVLASLHRASCEYTLLASRRSASWPPLHLHDPQRATTSRPTELVAAFVTTSRASRPSTHRQHRKRHRSAQAACLRVSAQDTYVYNIHDTRHPRHGSRSVRREHRRRRHHHISPGRHAVRGDLGVAWRRTANGTREQAEHAHLRDRRSRPERHPRRERAHGPGVLREERASISTDYIHSMHTETEHGVRHAGGRSTIER